MTASTDFSIDVERHANHVRVIPHGEIDISTIDDVRTSLRSAAGDAPGIVLDLRDVTFMGAEGLRMLHEALVSSGAEGWHLTLFRGPAQVQRVIDMGDDAPRLRYGTP
jgi:anti-anti-sigma factor